MTSPRVRGTHVPARLIVAFCAALCSALVACGCAPREGAATAPGVPALASRDGNIRYRMPPGWFDAGEDSLCSRCSLWLMRADYAGSLTVRPVHLRALGQGDLDAGGLLEVAKLTAALETSRRPGVLTRVPARTAAPGGEAVSYDVEYAGSGDRTRTVILGTGGSVYAVTALVSGNAPPGAAREIFGVLEAFLSSARWERARSE
ncbi:MAG TPA: hypothetical protein VL221_10610 [Bacteroidota bacterium]|nr:hypothetical protein [Bacteroidota bacterium]